MRKSPSLFITFEGTEGAGKSTLIHEVAALLRNSYGSEITLTREPGGNKVAERIRAVILEEPMDPWTELFLYEAARAEHVAKTIRPALKRGEIVLCDRYADSSLAYQAHARGLPWNEVRALNRMATQGLSPDLTVMLDIDPALGLQRAREHTRFEAEGLAFQQKVRRGFLKARSQEPKRWLVLKVGSATPQELATQVVTALTRKFARKLPKKAASK